MADIDMIIMAKRERIKIINNELDGLEEKFISRKKSLELEKRTLEQQLRSMERERNRNE